MCTNHHQQLFLPKAALPTKTASTRSRLSRHRRWEQSFPCCHFERRWAGAGETPPHSHTHTHLLPHSLAQPQPRAAFPVPARVVCAAGTLLGVLDPAGTARAPRGLTELPGNRWRSQGWLPVPGLQEDTVALFACAQCGRLPQLGTRRLVLFKRLLFSPCVFGKTRGEPGRGMRTTLASSALSFCCRGHLPGCTPSS